MPDVIIEKQGQIDLLPDTKPGLSTTSDMPKVETKPDVEVKKAATEEVKKEDVSATPDKPESASADPDAGKPPAKGVQKRLDELTRNWREEQRAREATQKQLSDALEMMKKLAEGKPAEVKADGDDPEPAEPDATKYTDQETYNKDYRAYLKQTARWEGRQEYRALQKKETEAKSKESQESEYRERVKAYESHVAKVRAEVPDYDTIASDPTLPISKPMASAIMEAGELGPKLVLHLHNNREEAARIAQLSPTAQFLELGAIKAALTQTPTKPSVSQAKPPIKPLSTGGSTVATSSDEESMEAYAAKRAKQLAEERRPGGRR